LQAALTADALIEVDEAATLSSSEQPFNSLWSQPFSHSSQPANPLLSQNPPQTGSFVAADEPRRRVLLNSGNGYPSCRQEGLTDGACPAQRHTPEVSSTPGSVLCGLLEDAERSQCTPKLLSSTSRQRDSESNVQNRSGHCSRESGSQPFCPRQQESAGDAQATCDELHSLGSETHAGHASAGLTPFRPGGQATISQFPKEGCLGSSIQPDEPSSVDLVLRSLRTDTAGAPCSRQCHNSGAALTGLARANRLEAPVQGDADQVGDCKVCFVYVPMQAAALFHQHARQVGSDQAFVTKNKVDSAGKSKHLL
jgi:hypothetical protein